MTSFATTMARFAQASHDWADAVNAASGGHAPTAGGAASRLRPVRHFGSNPGGLEMLVYVPARLAPRPALVVVLHGCGQDAAGYDAGAGWSDLADRHGFALLYPQQTSSNNPKSCFNWFRSGDIARDRGEALSIRQMVEAATAAYGIARERVYVTGLSAGGAMTAVMLATYPDVFAGGAVIAGLPYGGARSVGEALDSMFKGRTHTADEWGDLVRAASSHEGPWPTVSIWHGSADATVKPTNATELVKQWTDVHGVGATTRRRSNVDGHLREVWTDAAGREVVESFTVAGMGHGTPLHVGTGADRAGAAGPFLLDVGISSSHHIAAFWGLTSWQAPAERSVAPPSGRPLGGEARPLSGEARPLQGEVLPPGSSDERAQAGPGGSILDGLAAKGVRPDVLRTIGRAFRAAGLTPS